MGKGANQMIDVSKPELRHPAMEVREFLGALNYSKMSVEKLTPREFFDYWLRYQGIIGYTDQIIDVMKGLGWSHPQYGGGRGV